MRRVTRRLAVLGLVPLAVPSDARPAHRTQTGLLLRTITVTRARKMEPLSRAIRHICIRRATHVS
jgi:hypothetical protein